jgi:hypothetical protein
MADSAARRAFKSSVAQQTPDPVRVRSSRNFHFKHWLGMASAAIRDDHRQMLYGWLEPNLQATIAGYPEGELPPEVRETLLQDVAYIEGHLQAYRDILGLFEEISRRELEP